MTQDNEANDGSKAQVEDLTYVSESIPELPTPLVKRKFMLNSIEDFFKEASVVVLESPSGYGKTTLLSNFVRRNPMRTVNVFITSSRNWYQPEAVRKDICNQIHWILNNEEISNDLLDSPEFDSLSRLPRLIRSLSKEGRRENPYYFILDGINEIPEKDQHARREILEDIPFEAPGIRVIFTGSESDLPDRVQSEVECQPFTVAQFSKKETKEYLENLVEDTNIVQEIHDTCLGIPGRLASVRRILKSGASPDSVLRPDTQEIQDLFEMEWESVASKESKDLLAIVAHSEIDYTLSEISNILSIDQDYVSKILEDLEFMEVDNRNNYVSFVSDGFRKYAVNRLSTRRSDVQDWIIDDLMEDLESDRSLINLPLQLHETERYDDLIKYLSPDRFYRLLESAQSVGLASQVASLASEAAEARNDIGSLARFSLHQSSVSEMWAAHVKRSRVEALAALDEIEEALALVETAISDLERLQLLAVVARKIEEQGATVDKEILQELNQLTQDLDASDLSRATESIAADLLYVDPELALRLVEQSAGAGAGEHSLDVAYLKLSFEEALRSRDSSNPGIKDTDTLDDIQSNIEDPEVERISSKVSLVLGKYSAERVIDEAKSFEKTGDKLLFLRKWTNSHSNNSDAGDVIEYALREVIQNTDYAHDAGLLRELAEPLPSLEDEGEIKELIKVFNQQKDSIDSPVEELTRLEIILALAESDLDYESAEDRIAQLFFNLGELGDVAARTEGLARLASAIPLGEQSSDFEDEILGHITNDLESCVDELLSNSADQLNSTRQVIHGLASSHPQKALSIASRLNTEKRRDKGVLVFFNSLLHAQLQKIEIGTIFKGLQQIKSPAAKSVALKKVANRLYEESEEIEAAVRHTERIAGEISCSYDAKDRLESSVKLYELLTRAAKEGISYDPSLADRYLDTAIESLQEIDNDSSKIDLAYKSVDILASSDEDSAIQFKELAEESRNKITFENEESHRSFTRNVRLAIRSFRGLLPNDIDVKEDKNSLLDIISKVSAKSRRIRLLSELAFTYFREGRKEDGEEVVEDRIRPLLSNIPGDTSSLRNRMWAYAAPPLYLASNLLTLRNLEELPREYKDQALMNVVTSIVRGVMPSEPYKATRVSNEIIGPDEVHELLALMEKMERDGYIFRTCRLVVDSIVGDNMRNKPDKSLRISVHDDLKEIVEESLPSKKFIEHDGYLILCKSDLLRLKDTYTSVGTKEWINLLSDAKLIENEADRALVLSLLAEKHPVSSKADRERRLEILEEVEDLVVTLPTTKDRLERLEALAAAAKEIDRGLARDYYQQAFSLLCSEQDDVDSETRKEIERRLLSSAYRMDSEFASSLASLADDDPAHKHELERNIQRLKHRERISSQSTSEKHDNSKESNFPNVCWDGLGALNANRISPLKKGRAKEIFMRGRRFALENAYPVQSFAIEGMVEMYSETDQASRFLRPIFEATTQNARFVERLAVRSSEKQDQVVDDVADEGESTTIEIQAGERDKSMKVIKRWASKNVSERVVICDQFFGPADVKAIYLIQSVSPSCQIEILTSKHHHMQQGFSDIRSAYEEEWKRKYDQKMPEVRVVVAGKEDGTYKSPVHDRWWLSKESSIKAGTSFNGLGKSQYSEISILSGTKSRAKMEEFEGYLSARADSPDGTRISYEAVRL